MPPQAALVRTRTGGQTHKPAHPPGCSVRRAARREPSATAQGMTPRDGGARGPWPTAHSPRPQHSARRPASGAARRGGLGTRARRFCGARRSARRSARSPNGHLSVPRRPGANQHRAPRHGAKPSNQDSRLRRHSWGRDKPSRSSWFGSRRAPLARASDGSLREDRQAWDQPQHSGGCGYPAGCPAPVVRPWAVTTCLRRGAASPFGRGSLPCPPQAPSMGQPVRRSGAICGASDRRERAGNGQLTCCCRRRHGAAGCPVPAGIRGPGPGPRLL